MLRIEALRTGYDISDILHDVALLAGRGEFVGLIGPNGSGKTTLLRVIVRSLPRRSGTLLVDDRELESYSARSLAQRIAFVPQTATSDFDFTAFEVVLMGRNPYVKRLALEDEHDLAIARTAMQRAGCWHLAHRALSELSGGERQRVIIARALAQQPRLLLLDEPTLHLDLSNQIAILDLLDALRRTDQLTVLAVFHDLNLAARYCEQLFVLKEGRVVAWGRIADVLTPSMCAEVFGIRAEVGLHPQTRRLYVLPLGTESQ